MAIGEAEAFSERMKRELVALESANVYALMETESVVEEVCALLNIFRLRNIKFRPSTSTNECVQSFNTDT